MLTVGVVSLGCSKNRVDTELMLGILEKAGYRIKKMANASCWWPPAAWCSATKRR